MHEMDLVVYCSHAPLQVKKKQYTLGMTADKTELNLAEKLKGMCFNSGVVKRQDVEDHEGFAVTATALE